MGTNYHFVKAWRKFHQNEQLRLDDICKLSPAICLSISCYSKLEAVRSDYTISTMSIMFICISDVIIWLIMILNIIVIMLIEYWEKPEKRKNQQLFIHHGKLLTRFYSFFFSLSRWLTSPPSEMITNYRKLLWLIIEVGICTHTYWRGRERKEKKEKEGTKPSCPNE